MMPAPIFRSSSPWPRIGWVVDVQHDFMVPPEQGGRLYVRHLNDPDDAGAVRVSDAIARTAAWMRAHCDAVVYTGDWHRDGDAEIDRVAPDFRERYPAHCMGAGDDPVERAGAALIAGVAPDDAMAVLGRDPAPGDAEAAAREAVRGRPVFVQKTRFSVFEGQPLTDAFLAALASELGGRPEVIVCGVATDVCVKGAVDGFLDRGYAVAVVTDATWGLGLVPERDLFAAWAARGARLVTTGELAAAPATVPA